MKKLFSILFALLLAAAVMILLPMLMIPRRAERRLRSLVLRRFPVIS